MSVFDLTVFNDGIVRIEVMQRHKKGIKNLSIYCERRLICSNAFYVCMTHYDNVKEKSKYFEYNNFIYFIITFKISNKYTSYAI